jgi:L,D-transpeptidase YcbB
MKTVSGPRWSHARCYPTRRGWFRRSHSPLLLAVSLLGSMVSVAGAQPDVRPAEPALFQRRALEDALSRYRELAKDPRLAVLPASGKLRPGDPYPGLAQLAYRLTAVGDLPVDSTRGAEAPSDQAAGGGLYAGRVVEGVKHFQERHGLQPDGIIGPATWKQLRVPMERRVRQIELALERLRRLPEMENAPFLVVNVPSFQLYGFESPVTQGRPLVQMKVVVGTAARSDTPIFSDRMRYIDFRPCWYPPRSIIRDEIIPDLAQKADYLDTHEMELVSGTSDASPALAATPENLALFRAGKLRVRQRPGPKNSLGLVKFIFPNSHGVYLHDTPSHSLFARDRRDLSHGCIRVQDPVALAEFALRDQPEWTRAKIIEAMNGTKSQRVNLRRPLPIYIFYATAVARLDGEIMFYDDIYGYDMALDRALLSGKPYAP